MKNRKKDILVVLVIAVIAGAFFIANHFLFRDGEKPYAEIYLDGELVKTVELNQDQRFSLPERPGVILEIKNVGIAFAESDCPDKICVHSGYLSHTGQTASCLPNRMTVRVYGGGADADQPDIVIGAAGIRDYNRLFIHYGMRDGYEVSG